MSHSSSRALPQGPLARWARFAARHPWRVIAGWVVVVAVIAALSTAFGGSYTSVFSIPGSETQTAVEVLEEQFPAASGDSATIVFHARDGAISDPAVQQQIDSVLAKAAQLPEVVAVVSPSDNPAQISPDGDIAYATVQYAVPAMEVDPADVEALFDLIDASATDQLQVEAGGQIVVAGEAPEPASSEILGVGVAMVIMLVMFGSVVAMAIPIVTAVLGVALGTLLLPLLANGFTLHSMITSAFVSMMGLGVGIDYALFIVNRYRDNLAHGHDVEDAVSIAIDTSGRSVAFAGVTVAIGMLGLSLIRIPFVTGLGITGSVAVLASVVIAIFLMPAILGLLGRRAFAARIPRLGAPSTDKSSIWFRWGRALQSRPGIISAVTIAVLLVLASPALDMDLRMSDAGNNPETMHSRRAYDLMAEGFGPGVNGTLLVVLENDAGLDPAALEPISTALQSVDGVVMATPPTLNESGTTAILQVVPTTGPQDAATEDLVTTLRDSVLPDATQGTGIDTYVAGATAASIDLSAMISERMPIFYTVVIGLSLILLTVVFRSVVVPVKAAIATLLSVASAFGAIVAVFQWGWLQSLLNVEGTGPIESFMPMILFGVLFGLSMDYEVFLLSRVHEEHIHGTPAKDAMLDGVGYSGRVVAAAGAIMGAVFVSFLLEDQRMLQLIGFGLGFAILVDAFIVRLVLVPAIMTVLGERAWVFPRWLDRIVPNVSIEGPAEEDDAATGGAPGSLAAGSGSY